MVPFLAGVGTVLGLIGAGSLLVQARRLLRLGTACEVSIPIRALSLSGYAVWLAYGIAIHDLPLILVDVAGLGGAVLLLRITLNLRRRSPCAVQWKSRTVRG
jgi:uncharacterized protein with PQ loop repeat